MKRLWILLTTEEVFLVEGTSAALHAGHPGLEQAPISGGAI
jgi:hypothetical protein